MIARILAAGFVCVGMAMGQSALAPPSSEDAQGPVRVDRSVMAQMAITRPNPVYPEEAKEKQVHGTVFLDAIISKKGTVESLKVTSGPEELRNSARDTFSRWTYKPYLVKGEPVEVETTIIAIYNLSGLVATENGVDQSRVAETIWQQTNNKAQLLAEQRYSDMGIMPKQIGGGVSAPVAIYQRSPEYTAEATAAKFRGTVIVSVIVEQHGIPVRVHVTKGVGMGLDEKAVEAVKQYRFKPAFANGMPVAVYLDVKVNFEI